MSDWTSRRVSRRSFIGAGAAALAAAGYGSAADRAAAVMRGARAASGSKIGGTLQIYNWAQYINPADITAFQKQFHVNVHYTNYTSNEQLFTELQNTKGQSIYDVIVPDADHVRIEKGLGLLLKLDHSLIPNLKNLAPHWRNVVYDPGNVYSVVKDVGFTGFSYRSDRVKATLETWKDFFDFLPTAKKQGLKVNFIQSPAEVIGVALNSLGYSMNTEDPSQLNAVKQLMLKVRPAVTTINEVYLNDFIAGDIDLGITYSGDALRVRMARAKQNDVTVVAPQGRSELWTDNWCISTYSANPATAHAWINYILEPAVNAREMEYVQYEVGTPASYPLVGAESKDPLVVFGSRILNDYEVLTTTPAGLSQRLAIWTQFVAA